MTRRYPWWGWSGLALLVVLGPGCASQKADVQTTSGFASEDTAYGRVLSAHTRSVELYDGLATVAKGTASWRSPAVRSALAETTAGAYRLADAAARQLRMEQERSGKRVREFHLALYTGAKDWNDLESADTLWKAYLVLPDGERLEAVQVIHLPKSDKSFVEYPYVTPWSREYTLFFPLLTGSEPHEQLELVLSGPLGTMSFRF